MFCAKCGNELPENALFCGECGSKVEIPDADNVEQRAEQQAILLIGQESAEQQQSNLSAGQWQVNLPVGQQPYMQKNAKPIPFITKVLFVEVIVLAITVFVSYKKIKEYTSPETVAKSYFTAVMSGDTGKAYDLIEVDESEFVNEKYFGGLLKDIGQKNVYNYKVDDMKDTGDGLDFKTTVKITYRLKEDTSDYSFYVELEKASAKKFFLIDDWKVNIGDYIQKDVTLYVNEGSKVILDGTEINKKYLSDEREEHFWGDQYVIPKMFSGTYEVLVTNDIYTDCKMSLTVDEENTSFYEGNDGNDDVTIKPEIMENIAKQAQKDFKTLWSNAVQQKLFKGVNDISMTEDKTEIEEEYEELAERFKKEDGEGLQKINFGNFEIVAEEASDSDLEYPAVYVSFSAPFSCVEMDKDWWSGELESSEGSGDYTGGMSYACQNGEWRLQYVSISKFYYY